MAEQEKVEKEQAAEPARRRTKGPLAKILPWLIPAAVVLVFAVGGFLVGRLVRDAGPGPERPPPSERSGGEPALPKNLDP